MEKDRNYFMRRAAQERSAVDRASDDVSRRAHLEMAQRYRDLVRAKKVSVSPEHLPG